MILKQKYIKTRLGNIIVFSEMMKHSAFAKFEPVSAGFIYFTTKKEMHNGKEYHETDCVCHGQSDSLGLKSDEKDTLIAQRQILGKLI